MKIRRFLRVRHHQPDVAILAEKNVLKTLGRKIKKLKKIKNQKPQDEFNISP
jgi:hypothetical protein